MFTGQQWFYIDQGRRVYEAPSETMDHREHIILPELNSVNTQLAEAGVLCTPFVNSFLVEHNTWYFEYENGDIDTLYVENNIISKEEGRQNECYCINPFSIVRFNGKDAYKHPTLKAADGKPVWVLER